ncbi:tetratricopeptide repeat protein [Lacinutrix venerupis]|uniref:Tetratricopeptide repeat protein n=1 Tax=Lacinutrix venerupis TaxID=1486034 RepID=A0AAC9LLV2_9FLAO|nr:tetratricopeptide repeat protein [Lacinutrix venerupis]APX99726.1 hypothetical protein BWR22_05180 [Lacinutrix venerupis]
MKKNYIITFIFLILIKVGYSQDYEIKTKTKQLIESRSIYLNGGLNATFGGQSRTYLEVDLPPNTVKWYYSFSTKKGKSGTQNLNLAIQLTGMMSDPSGITSSTLSAIKVPDGVASADIYLCDRPNIDKFLSKKDLYGGSYSYNMEGSAQSTKQAVVEIDDIRTGTVYLGLKNPSTNNGVNISIEVVAITETQVPIVKSDSQQKAELYGGLGWTNFENGNYEKCIEYCDKANAEFKLGWVLANKGLAQLMTDKESEAMETYIEAITLIKKQPNPSYVFGEMIKDIENAKKLNPDLNGADEIKQLIEMQRG